MRFSKNNRALLKICKKGERRSREPLPQGTHPAHPSTWEGGRAAAILQAQPVRPPRCTPRLATHLPSPHTQHCPMTPTRRSSPAPGTSQKPVQQRSDPRHPAALLSRGARPEPGEEEPPAVQKTSLLAGFIPMLPSRGTGAAPEDGVGLEHCPSCPAAPQTQALGPEVASDDAAPVRTAPGYSLGGVPVPFTPPGRPC